jgi:hypothetical protein
MIPFSPGGGTYVVGDDYRQFQRLAQAGLERHITPVEVRCITYYPANRINLTCHTDTQTKRQGIDLLLKFTH